MDILLSATLKDPQQAEHKKPHEHSASSEEHVDSVTFPGKKSDTTREAVEILPENHEPSYPEGGLKAWLVVLGSFSGMLAVFGFMNSIGIYQEYLTRNQLAGYQPGIIGWIFSVYIFLSFGGGLFIGPVFDAKGPKMLLVAGTICFVSGIMLVSISTEYWHFILTIGLLSGIGTSLIFAPTVAAVGHYFKERRGFATGIAATGGSVGGIMFPLSLNRLFETVGFGWGTRILAFIFLLLCVTSVFLVSSRLPPKHGASIWPDARIFLQPSFTLATVGTFCTEWGLFIPVAYLSTFVISTKITDEGSNFPSAVITILNAGSTLGRFVPGLIADKFGRFNCMIAMLVLCMTTTIGIWLPITLLPEGSSAVQPLIILYAILFGFGSGSNISLTPVCIGQLCETEEYGRYYATCYTAVSIGSLTGIPIAGALLQACNGHYYGVVAFTGFCYIIAFLGFVGARWSKVGWKMCIY